MSSPAPVTITVQEIIPGQSVVTPWGVVNVPATSSTKQLVLTPDQLAILKAALAQ